MMKLMKLAMVENCNLLVIMVDHYYGWVDHKNSNDQPLLPVLPVLPVSPVLASLIGLIDLLVRTMMITVL